MRASATCLFVMSVGCSSASPEDPLARVKIVGDDPSDIPLIGASDELVARFRVGDAMFDAVLRESDGLGPLYIRTSCAACHDGASRGPGAVEKMVVVDRDGVPSTDQSALVWGHTVRPYATAGATEAIEVPDDTTSIKVTTRLGPAVFGRGYVEAVDAAEIERVEAEQALRADGIAGRINRVTYESHENPDALVAHYGLGDVDLMGRFGLKGRNATLDDFCADAFQGDMGITSPMRPDEVPNPEGLTDDSRMGIDVDLDRVNVIADYMRLLEIPERVVPTPRAEALFARAKCDVCHVPRMATRGDYPIDLLAGISAPIYSDLLLHDMGDELADGLADQKAGPREWKTAPLIGLRHEKAFLHDGRAPSIEQAILLHGGTGSQARGSAELFRELSPADKTELLAFVASL
jgi:CxxC motif-containing protein (DUF1111 family)